MEQFRLDDKISLVTGGSKGIGFGIARALAEAGADLALVARDKNTLEKAREKLGWIPKLLFRQFSRQEITL